MNVGSAFGHYDITALLGEGGMGQVYRATDRRLKREVALKVLPPETAAHPDRLERFQREAQAVAALNHPNVVTIYSVEHEESTHFITMELVEGRTLAEMIPHHGLALERFLALAVPLADAVSAAHARGIIHRDLKPANVMVDAGGRLKVLDFGLAKLRESTETADLEPTRSAARATGEGRIVGTANYMSPEQAEGRPVDHRTDIFSMGVMLYEMTCGQRPFKGDTPLATLLAIVRDEPPKLSDARADFPRDCLQAVRKCLAKDPERRYQSAKDLRNDLDDIRASLASGDAEPESVAGSTRKSRTGRVAAMAGVGVIALGGLLAWVLTRPSDRTAAVWRDTQLTSEPGVEMYPALSPDGRSIAYVVGTVPGARDNAGDIYLKSVGGSQAINLTAGSKARNSEPAFSPDGERIAFVSSREGGGIYVMGRQGDAVRRLTTAGSHPSWAPDSTTIVYCVNGLDLPLSRNPSDQLWVVDVATTSTRRIEGPFEDVVHPRFSPDGSRIAYWGLASGGNREVWTVAVTGGEPVRVTNDRAIDWNPVWAPDGRSLYFLSDRTGTMQIWNVDIDQRTGTTSGDPRVLTTPARFVAHLSISADGRRLTYMAYDGQQNIVRYAFDPVAGALVGQPSAVTSGSRQWNFPALSPDGSMLAFTSWGLQEDIYVARADGTGLTPLTNDPEMDRVPQWSPNGRTLAFYSLKSGRLHVWRSQADGLDRTQVTDSKDGATFLGGAWSPDGNEIAAARSAASGLTATSVLLRLDASGRAITPTREVPGGAGMFPNSWSLDGQWIAGFTFVGEPMAVNVTTGERRLFGGRGSPGVWLPDSRRLIYGSRAGLMLVDVLSGASRQIGPPALQVSLSRDGNWLALVDRREEGDIWMISR